MLRVSRKMRERRIERNEKILIASFVAIVFVFACFAIYTNDYYRADTDAIDSFLPEVEENIEIRELNGGATAYLPDEIVAGVIFYPETKVEATAYVPLMRALAEEGIAAVLVEMPFNMPKLKSTAANGIKEQLFFVEDWYIAGHGDGGKSAASFLAKNAEGYKGLILMGAYTDKDLTNSGLKVLSIYGELDSILDQKKYHGSKDKLPEGYVEIVLEGANHSGFGMYGLQDTDSEATVTATRQIKQTVSAIVDFVK